MLSQVTKERDEFKAVRRRLRRAAKTPVPDQLIEQIRSAFANMETPSAESLVSCPCPECQGVKRRYAGKHWTEITDPLFFRMFDDSFALLDAAAFRFYLPAFLLGDLLNLGPVDKRARDYTFFLTPPCASHRQVAPDPAEAEYEVLKLEHLSGFTAEQKDVIRAYLRFCFKRRPAALMIIEVEHQRTLDFWETFEG